MDSWLIRTSQNQIHRPCSADEVRRLILEGRLKLQDEVCPGTGYWFYLHEAEELKKHLGIEMPRVRSGGVDEEITETSTQTDPDLTDPHFRVVPVDSGDSKQIPFARAADPAEPGPLSAASFDPQFEARGMGIEPQPILWAIVILVLSGGGGGILYWVWKLLGN